MTIVIEQLLAGKALDLALKGVRGAARAFGEQDSVGRLLVLLHADFGDEADLGRDAFYSWRDHPQLTAAFEAVVIGELLEHHAGVHQLADLIAPRLVRTPPDAQQELARRVAVAVFRAAPIVVEGGTPETRLLLAHIDAARARSHAPQPGRPRRVRFQLPLVVAHFTGREELATLERLLASTDRADVTQAITGLGGVGKSQLAARYVQKHLDEYDVVAWIRAQDGGLADLARLASELREVGVDMTAEERAEAAIAWLTGCTERWLLVLDNLADAEQLAACCPSSGNGRVLITTRDQAVAHYAPALPVKVFDESTAVDYLLARTERPDDRLGALRVARALGCLPLALAHAGAYCAQGTALDDYLHLLEGLPARELFDRSSEASHRETVASTWQISIQAAAQQAALAPDVLAMASYLAPDDIPRALFDALIDPDDMRQRKALIDAAAALHRFSLAILTPGTLGIHPLLQRVVRESPTSDPARPQRATLNALASALPGDPEQPDRWTAYEALVPHILALGDAYSIAGDGDAGALALLNNACLYLLHAGAQQRAVDAATMLARRAEELLGDEHPDTLTARANLANSYRQVGRTTDAIAIEEPVVSDTERLLGDEHPNTLTARANLARSYRQVGRTTDAIAIEERVVSDSERLLGDEHPNTLRVRANLANSYRQAGRTTDAIAIEERVVSDTERLLGDEHPDTLGARANLANSYAQAGRTTDAIAILEHVASDSERLLGDEHPHTLTARANLANCYWQAGRTAHAIAIEERVVSDTERLLGDEHPHTLTARANLANSYREAGRTADAIAIEERAVNG